MLSTAIHHIGGAAVVVDVVRPTFRSWIHSNSRLCGEDAHYRLGTWECHAVDLPWITKGRRSALELQSMARACKTTTTNRMCSTEQYSVISCVSTSLATGR
jgi:hypothetical protein